VIMVSHNMTQISRMCGSVVLLEKGRHSFHSTAKSGIDAYNSVISAFGSKQAVQHTNGKAKLARLQIRGSHGDGRIVSEEPCQITFDLWVSPEVNRYSVLMSVLSREHQPVAYCKKTFASIGADSLKQTVFVMPNLVLAPGNYSLAIAIMNEDRVEQLLWYYNVAPFVVVGNDDFVGVSVVLSGRWDAGQAAAEIDEHNMVTV